MMQVEVFKEISRPMRDRGGGVEEDVYTHELPEEMPDAGGDT